MGFIGGGNPSVDSNILRGEQNLWDDGYWIYSAMEKVTLSGRLQTKLRPQNVTEVWH